MIDPSEFVDTFLKHAETRYYDPVKAREYYLRTRELKGRPKASALKTDQAREAWDYSKSEIDKAQTAEFKEAKDRVEAEVLKLRETATEKQKIISEKFTELFNNIRKQQEEKRNAIAEEKAAEVEKIQSRVIDEMTAVTPVPRGLSRADTARLSDIRRAEIAKIKAAGAADIKKLDEKFAFEADMSEAQAGRNSASEEIKKLVDDLKANIEQAKKNYEDIRASLEDKYNSEYVNEFNAIDEKLNRKPADNNSTIAKPSTKRSGSTSNKDNKAQETASKSSKPPAVTSRAASLKRQAQKNNDKRGVRLR